MTVDEIINKIRKNISERTGYWIVQERNFFHPNRFYPITVKIKECSVCKYKTTTYDHMNYCPNCGMKMENEIQKEEEEIEI